MKRLAATAITLMMTAAIGTAAASPWNHGDDRQGAGHGYDRGHVQHVDARYEQRGDFRGRWDGHDGDRRWHGDNGYRGNGYGYGYGWYRGYRYEPCYVSVVVGGAGAPYYAPAYYGPAYGYAYERPYAYGNGYATCAPGTAYTVPVQRDNTGAKLFGAVVGGALGNTVGKGNGRVAATVAGAAIGYGIASGATSDRSYETVCSG